MPRCNEATFAPLCLKKDTTSLACRQPRDPSTSSTHPYILARCGLALTFLALPAVSRWSKKVASDFAASALDLRTCRITLRVGGRCLLTNVTGGSFTIGGVSIFCTHRLSGGVAGVVYCERAARGRSQCFGAQTPTNTRHAATRRLALKEMVCKHVVRKISRLPTARNYLNTLHR